MGGLPKKGKLYGRKLNSGQERNRKGDTEHNTDWISDVNNLLNYYNSCQTMKEDLIKNYYLNIKPTTFRIAIYLECVSLPVTLVPVADRYKTFVLTKSQKLG